MNRSVTLRSWGSTAAIVAHKGSVGIDMMISMMRWITVSVAPPL